MFGSNIYGRQAPTITPQQTNADVNYNNAMAAFEGNPRFTQKKFTRPGISAGRGAAYAGALQSANAYATNMGKAANTQMSDAYYNANMNLTEQSRNDQFSHALAGLYEDSAQSDAMFRLKQAQGAYGFMGDMLKNMSGGFAPNGSNRTSLLMGLL